MKKNVLLICVAIFTMFTVSCSKDDNKDVEAAPELAGEWQLKNVDFTVLDEEGTKFPANDGCVIELVSGYIFEEDQKLRVILGKGDLFDPYAADYWTWEGDINNFKIVQTNPARPPYNFGLTPTNIEVRNVNGKWTMTFHAELYNGSAANFTMVKTDKLNTAELPILTKPDGSVYVCGFFGD